MKVFISSVIHGYGHYRDGVAEIIKGLGYESIRSEDFSAQPHTPQQACLQAVRESDVMVLLLGEKYGTEQTSGLSATHEEFEEAKRGGKPVLVFVESKTCFDQKQEQLIDKIKRWDSGQTLKNFSNLADLKCKVMRSLHKLILDISSPSVDSTSLKERAEYLIDGDFNNREPWLSFSLVGNLKNQIIRPAMLGNSDFWQRIDQYAKKEEYPVLEGNKETKISIEKEWLILQQISANIHLCQDGEIVIQKYLMKNHNYRDSLPVIIKERVSEHISGILHFCANTLDEIDTGNNISWISVAIRITGNKNTPLRTEAEHKENPNRINVDSFYKVMKPISLAPFARLALRRDLIDIREDLVAVIDREVYHG